MRAHIIENSVVVNTIEVESLDFLPNLVEATEGSIGWIYDGEKFYPPTVDLSSIRATKWEAIKSERERRSQQGGYPAAGKWFHSDTFSRSQQLGLVIMGANIPPGLMWKTMDGSFIEMTPAVAQQVFQAAAAQDNAIFAHAESLKMDVGTSPDPASVDITAGWPLAFGE